MKLDTVPLIFSGLLFLPLVFFPFHVIKQSFFEVRSDIFLGSDLFYLSFLRLQPNVRLVSRIVMLEVSNHAVSVPFEVRTFDRLKLILHDTTIVFGKLSELLRLEDLVIGDVISSVVRLDEIKQILRGVPIIIPAMKLLVRGIHSWFDQDSILVIHRLVLVLLTPVDLWQRAHT